MKTQVCIGIDPSLAGHAVSVLRDGELDFAMGWTDKKMLQKKRSKTLNYFKIKERSEANSQYRLQLLVGWTLHTIAAYQAEAPNAYAAIEGYAFSKRSKGLHEMHGLSEMIKQGLWARNIPFRVYDPLSVKLAWTGHGHATKEMMQEASRVYFGNSFEVEGSAGENLADATLIAGLLHLELEIKSGRLALAEADESLRRVMLRTTKSSPVAIISQDFVVKEGATASDPIFGGNCV
jgi:Holliday junction resolvasome RuvABC endonuclease subunit